MSKKVKLTPRQRIKYRIRKKIIGTSEKPRLVIFRSLNNIYAQLVDDVKGRTICSVSSLSKDIKGAAKKIEKSKIVGKKIAEKASENKIKKVVFDRNGYLYHGRVKAIADAARESGLEF
jgi:large subunit ribosomal protein L18